MDDVFEGLDAHLSDPSPLSGSLPDLLDLFDTVMPAEQLDQEAGCALHDKSVPRPSVSCVGQIGLGAFSSSSTSQLQGFMSMPQPTVGCPQLSVTPFEHMQQPTQVQQYAYSAIIGGTGHVQCQQPVVSASLMPAAAAAVGTAVPATSPSQAQMMQQPQQQPYSQPLYSSGCWQIPLQYNQQHSCYQQEQKFRPCTPAVDVCSSSVLPPACSHYVQGQYSTCSPLGGIHIPPAVTFVAPGTAGALTVPGSNCHVSVPQQFQQQQQTTYSQPLLASAASANDNWLASVDTMQTAAGNGGYSMPTACVASISSRGMYTPPTTAGFSVDVPATVPASIAAPLPPAACGVEAEHLLQLELATELPAAAAAAAVQSASTGAAAVLSPQAYDLGPLNEQTIEAAIEHNKNSIQKLSRRLSKCRQAVLSAAVSRAVQCVSGRSSALNRSSSSTNTAAAASQQSFGDVDEEEDETRQPINLTSAAAAAAAEPNQYVSVDQQQLRKMPESDSDTSYSGVDPTQAALAQLLIDCFSMGSDVTMPSSNRNSRVCTSIAGSRSGTQEQQQWLSWQLAGQCIENLQQAIASSSSSNKGQQLHSFAPSVSKMLLKRRSFTPGAKQLHLRYMLQQQQLKQQRRQLLLQHKAQQERASRASEGDGLVRDQWK